jgi:outer membrane lipoprotein-sorting protein
MNNRLKQELENIEVPEEFEQRSQIGINKAYYEMNRKSNLPKTIIACAITLFVTVGAWMTPPVKATIQNALNLLLADKFEAMDNGRKMDDEQVLVGVEKNSVGEKVTTYISVENNTIIERTENENGNFSVSNGNVIASYTKEDNTFLIESSNQEGPPIEKELFLNIENENIKSLGTKHLFGREVDTYNVTMSEDEALELWFDKETDILIREIQIINDEAFEEGKLLSLETVKKQSVAELFEIRPPEGAKVIDHTKK